MTGNQQELIGDAGLDLQYQYGTNVVANLTFNPDFATVEGDKEQINLTPWELRFPEKRLFFQDGNEMFRTRISTFYSRRIGDLQYGGKMIGKAGKYQFNALTAHTEENIAANHPDAWFNAIRIKRDVLKSSTVGFTYADKITDTLSFRSYSTDFVFNLGKTWKLTGQWVTSTPGDLKSHSAWFIRAARENNIYHYHLRYTNLGSNFQNNVNQTGFVSDDDRREFDSDISYRFWRDDRIKYIEFEGRNNVFWSQTGQLRSWNFTYGGRMYMSNSFSFDAYYNNEYKLLESDFHNNYYRLIFGYRTDEATYISAGYRKGKNFGRDFDLVEAKSRIQLFDKLTLSYEMTYLAYSQNGENDQSLINVLGADFFFTKDLWIRMFIQNNSTIDKYYFYGLFGWRFKPPFGAAYFIVNSDQYFDSESNMTIRSELVFLKLTYPFNIL